MSLAEKTFKNGEVIIKEGDIGKSFFQLLEGKANVVADYGKKDQLRLAVLEAGEYFGEMAIIETYPRSATVVAEGNVRVIEIPESELNEYFTQNPDMILELMKHLGNRVRTMTKDYNDAQALLKQLREADSGKKNSLFSKIKKHIDLYQSNKNKMPEHSAESMRATMESVGSDTSGNIESYSAGTVIFSEGEYGRCMYILQGGKVGIYNNYGQSNELKLTELLPVTFFGEMGMISEEDRSATAVAEQEGTCVEIIFPEDLENMFKTNPVKVDAILRHLSFRLRKLTVDFLNTCKEITEAYND